MAQNYSLARLNLDGSLDRSFLDNLPGPDGDVYALVVQSDGKIIAGGWFFTVNSVPRSSIGRLDSDGALDSTFINGPAGPDGSVECLSIQRDGKVLVGGYFTSINGVPRNYLARLNPNGSIDTSFLEGLAGPNGYFYCLALQSDGKLVIGGCFSSVNGMPRNNVARLNPDGSLDTSFLEGLAGPDNCVFCLALQSDGKVVIGGSFTSVNGTPRSRIARLNADGSLDTSFLDGVSGADWSVDSVVVQGDAKVLVGGSFNLINGVPRNYLARLNADGSLDRSFLEGMSGMNSSVLSMALPGDGKILIGGYFTSVNGVPVKRIARLDPDGSLDHSFLNGLSGADDGDVASLALQRDGKILIAGEFGSVDGVPHGGVARLNPDGSLDGSFLDGLAGPDSSVYQVALQADGRILIGGSFSSVNGIARSHLARLMGEYVPLAILVGPQSQTAETGSTVQFWARATCFPAPLYQWFFNGTESLGNGPNSTLSLPNVQPVQAGTYTVVVTNITGAITSSPAMLSIIPVVERRAVPGLNLTGDPGSSLHLEYTDAIDFGANWVPLDVVTLTMGSQLYFDLTAQMTWQRFYRAWRSEVPGILPTLNLHAVPAITLTGAIGGSLRVDYINQFGPTNAWVTLATVTLTNSPQLYFDTSVIGQPPRLYRLVPVP